MEWLSQNWGWLLLGVGVFAMMRRRGGGAGHGGGCCGGHGADDKHPGNAGSPSKSTADGGAGHHH